jgi:hypothetical protein
VGPPPAEPTLIQPPVPVEPPPAEPTLIQPQPELTPAELPTEADDDRLEMPAAAALEGATVETEVSEDDDFGFDEEDDLDGPGVTKAEAKAVAESMPETSPPLDEPVKPSLNKVAAKATTTLGKKTQGPGLLTQIQEGLRGLLNFRKAPPVKSSPQSSQPVQPKTEAPSQPAIAVESLAVKSEENVTVSPVEATPTVVVKTPEVTVEVTVEDGEPVEVVTSSNAPETESVEAVTIPDEVILIGESELEMSAPTLAEAEAEIEIIHEEIPERITEENITPEVVEESTFEGVELAPPAEAVILAEELVAEGMEELEATVEINPTDSDELELPPMESDRLLERPQRQDPAVVEAVRESGEAQVTPNPDLETTPENETKP